MPVSSERRELEVKLRELHAELGHAHPDALAVEMELGACLHALGHLNLAREALEEVLTYRSVLDGDHGVLTARVARDLFRLLCEQDDRSAMAEVYYRYLPMYR